jgi:hypothetical protein
VTATTSPAQAPTPQVHRWGPVLWAVALAWSVVIAVFGVNAAMGAIQKKQYADVRVGAVYLLSNGNTIDGSIARLHEVNVRDYGLLKDAQAALKAGNTPLFYRLTGQADVFSVEQQSLQQDVQDYQAGFDRAVPR